MIMLTQETALNLINYVDGKLYWKVRDLSYFTKGTYKRNKADCLNWNNKYSGKQIKNKNAYGYYRFNYKRKTCIVHRVVWLMFHGEWPKQMIDHINHDRTDNRIENLRDVSNQENAKNAKISESNKSGFTGVYWSKVKRKWIAYITIDGKTKHLASCENIQDAINERTKANIKYNYHKNHGGDV